jgi:hypothetical protein
MQGGLAEAGLLCGPGVCLYPFGCQLEHVGRNSFFDLCVFAYGAGLAPHHAVVDTREHLGRGILIAARLERFFGGLEVRRGRHLAAIR